MTCTVSISFYFRCNGEEQTKPTDEASATASDVESFLHKMQAILIDF